MEDSKQITSGEGGQSQSSDLERKSSVHSAQNHTAVNKQPVANVNTDYLSTLPTSTNAVRQVMDVN
jgi:hypothetical protein